MRKYVPILIGAFIASLAWLGIASYLRYQSANWDGEMPDGIDFVGTWQIESRVTDGHELSGENLQQVRDHGFDSFVVLNLDASAKLVLYGNVFSGSWLARGAADAIITTNEVRKPMRLVDGKVILGDDFDYFVFAPSTPEAYEAYLSEDHTSQIDDEFVGEWGLDEYLGNPDAEAAEASQEGQTDEPAPPEPDENGIYPLDLTIADDELVTIKVTGKGTDHLGCPGYYLRIVNNSELPFTVTRELDSFTVDGSPATPVLSEDLEPGASTDVYMWWDASDVTSIESLANVVGTIEVDELNGFVVYGTYDFIVS